MKQKFRNFNIWSYDKMLIDRLWSSRLGKYLALGHDAGTSLHLVRRSGLRANIFTFYPPTHSISTYCRIIMWSYVPACEIPYKTIVKADVCKGQTDWREPVRKKPWGPTITRLVPKTKRKKEKKLKKKLVFFVKLRVSCSDS